MGDSVVIVRLMRSLRYGLHTVKNCRYLGKSVWFSKDELFVSCVPTDLKSRVVAETLQSQGSGAEEVNLALLPVSLLMY